MAVKADLSLSQPSLSQFHRNSQPKPYRSQKLVFGLVEVMLEVMLLGEQPHSEIDGDCLEALSHRRACGSSS